MCPSRPREAFPEVVWEGVSFEKIIVKTVKLNIEKPHDHRHGAKRLDLNR